MQILLVYCSTDPYNHEEFAIHRQMIEGEYSQRDLENVKKDYLNSFAVRKTISKISLTHLDVSISGEVTILENVQGAHPFKTRKEINPAAVQAKAARMVRVKKLETPLPFGEFFAHPIPGDFSA